MKTKLSTRITAALAAAMIAVGAAVLPTSAKYNTSGTSQGEAFSSWYPTNWKNSEKWKYPAGKYWNGGNVESYTNSPCTNQTWDWHTWSNCNYMPFRFTINSGYTALPSSEQCSSICQCYGFARKLAQDFYGGCKVWTRQRTYKNFTPRVGDQVRIKTGPTDDYGHSIFVTETNGNAIKFADCNWYGTCQIRWDVDGGFFHNGTFILGSTPYTVLWIDRPAMAGDVNGDSTITQADINAISQIYRGVYNYGSANRKYVNEAADLDNDGRVTYSDWAMAYYQYTGNGYLQNQRFLTWVDL